MTTANLQVRLLFNGGWATDFGPTTTASIQQDGTVRIPFLVNAENCIYDLDGGPKKIGGTARINSSAFSSGSNSNVNGIFDYWRLGTVGSANQDRIVHVGTVIKKDDGDASFTDIKTGLEEDVVPSYEVYDDDLIIMSDSGDVPLKWDGSSIAHLWTNTPNGAFGATHKNRFWMAGVRTTPSRLYFSEPLPNGADGNWDQVEAGFIDIDPEDGDKITGLISHKGELWVFKGPYTGSIHRVRGDTPLGAVTAFGASTQPVPFGRENFVRGLGSINHNSIFRFKDDIGFIDARTATVHSLNATAAFGDFREAALSLPINDYLSKRVNRGALGSAWSVTNTSRDCVLITLSVDTASRNNTVLCMDHRFDPVRWSSWPDISAQCIAMVVDPTDEDVVVPFLGDDDGFIRKTEQANRSIDDSTGIAYKVTTPYLDFGNPIRMKTFERGSVGIQPKGAYNGTFNWSRDDRAKQSVTFSQAGGDVLAGTVSTTLNVAVGPAINIGGGVVGIDVASGGSAIAVGDEIQISGTTNYNGKETVASKPSADRIGITESFTAETFTGGGVELIQSIPPEANFFVLGTSTLGGARFVDRFFSLEEGGEFRSIQLEVTQSGKDEDIELHNISMTMALGADSGEN